MLISVVVFHSQTPNCDCFDFSFFEKNWYLHEGLTENLFLVWWIFFEILNDSGFAVLLLLRFSFFSTGANATAANGKRETSVYIFKLYLVPVNSTSFNFFFVSRLQQDKFQQMSDQIITRNILYIIWSPNLKWILLFND